MLRKQQPSPHTGGYIPIRNDATILSMAERNLILSTSTQNSSNATFRSIDTENLYLRVDGRKRTERRPISLQLLRQHDTSTDTTGSSHRSATTATVIFGAGTRVTCTVTSELVAPMADRPNDGILSFTIDISPSASTTYRYATPASTYNLGSSAASSSSNLPNADRYQKITANHILRTLERCFVQPGGAIDTEALCVVSGSYVWKIHCACTILDDSGNIIDASVLACIAAIRHYRQPVVELASTSNAQTGTATTNTGVTPIIIPSHIKEPTPLPLLHTPVAISFIFIANNSTTSSTSSGRKMGILIDPTNREELCCNGRITIGMNVYKEICFLDVTTGYNCEIQMHDIQYCYAVAESSEHIATICQILESALSDADEVDRNQRLLQLQHLSTLPLPPPTGSILPPGMEDLEYTEVDDDTETHPIKKNDEAEEDILYRRRALDFTIGHVASKVRENNDEDKTYNQKHATNKGEKSSNTLLESMLRSVHHPQESATTDRATGIGVPKTGDKIEAATTTMEEEEEDVMELKSEFVTGDQNVTTVTSLTNKRKR